MDREKVIKALECLNEGSYCECCDYKPYDDCIKRVATDALALLKEQEDLGTELTNAVELIHKKNERIEKLLKWQKAVEPLMEGKVPGGSGSETAEEKSTMSALEAVVYCKDCKFFDEHMEECNNRKSTACIEGWVYGDWFCADGERKEGR